MSPDEEQERLEERYRQMEEGNAEEKDDGDFKRYQDIYEDMTGDETPEKPKKNPGRSGSSPSGRKGIQETIYLLVDWDKQSVEKARRSKQKILEAARESRDDCVPIEIELK